MTTADEETPLIGENSAPTINLRDIRREQGFSQNAVPEQASSTFMDRVKSRVTNTASNVGANAGSSWDNCLSSLGGSCSALQTAWGSMFNYTRIQLGYLAIVVLTSIYASFMHTCAYTPSLVSLAPLGISVFNLLNFLLPAVFVPSDEVNQRWFGVSMALRLFRLVFADFYIFWLSFILGILDLIGPTEKLNQAGVPNHWALHICKACVIIDTNTYLPLLFLGAYATMFDYAWAVFVLLSYIYSIHMMRFSTPFVVTMGLAIVLILCRSV